MDQDPPRYGQRIEDQPGEVPVCPRHPDRPSYVRCQRCGRPTCPECQRTAPVGFQCVDCVREAAKGQRAEVTVLGGRRRLQPWATWGITAVCVLLWLAQLASPRVTLDLAFAPALGGIEPWRLVTSGFVHSTGPTGILHIGFNLFALVAMGRSLEPAVGAGRFLATFLLSVVGGALGFALALGVDGPEAWTPVVGASGGVFGLFAAVVIVGRRAGVDVSGLIGVIGINLVLGLVVAGIAWQAHLGGLAVGALCGGALVSATRRDRRWVQWALLGAIAVALLLVWGALYLV